MPLPTLGKAGIGEAPGGGKGGGSDVTGIGDGKGGGSDVTGGCVCFSIKNYPPNTLGPIGEKLSPRPPRYDCPD
jgi:hypothetical protein